MEIDSVAIPHCPLPFLFAFEWPELVKVWELLL